MLRRRNIVEGAIPPSTDSIWLDEGVAKAFINGEWVSIAGGGKDLEEKVDSIQKDVTVLNSKAIVELEIGDSESVKANNLSKLQAIQSTDNLFFADIAQGYGAAKWSPDTGGEAFMITSDGKGIIYTIGIDGSVTRKSTDINLTNPNTELFEVVTELPTENISTSKIYCVLSSDKDEKNKYTEYAYIKQTDGQYAWEKMGEFKAQPNLSNYARLNGYNVFSNDNYFNGLLAIAGEFMTDTIQSQNSIYLRAYDKNDQSSTKTYVTNGELADIGTKENLVFTLEDGSTVTKSIRVLSTTTTPAT